MALLVSEDCGSVKTFSAKGKQIIGHSGTNWDLTADTMTMEDILKLEYILDGTQIKIGSGEAAKAAAAAAADWV